jgi:glycosyltransferase involved in cell wall biosynthesis
MSEILGAQRLLTVVIPIANMSGKLENLNQTILQAENQDIDFILVHDKQDDSTGPELIDLIKKNKKHQIKLIEGTYGNPGGARNAGLREATGTWIIFWDSDDLGFAAQVCSAIKEAPHDASVIIGQCSIHDMRNSKEESRSPVRNLRDLPRFPGMWRIAFKNQQIAEFPELRMGEDQLFLEKNLKNRTEITFSGLNFYTYFEGVSTQLTSHKKNIADLKIIIDTEFNDLKTKEIKNSHFVTVLIFRQIVTCLKYGDLKLRRYATIRLLRLVRFMSSVEIARTVKDHYVHSSDDRTVYVSLTGGLGNQMFQLAAAVATAEQSPPRLITSLGIPRVSRSGAADIYKYDLSRIAGIEPTRDASFIEKKAAGFGLRMGVAPRSIESLSPIKGTLKVCITSLMSIFLRKKVSIEIAQGVGFYEIKKTYKDELLLGYFQSFKWVQRERVYNKFISLQLKEDSEFLNRMSSRAEGKKILGIHIRLGDYKSESAFGVLSPIYFQEALKFLYEGSNYSEIWIFSDEPEFAKKHYCLETLLPLLWIEDSNVSSAETLEVMRLCSGYIISNSSFSWWGALLSRDQSAQVIAPSKWFQGMDDPVDLLPPNWITIKPTYLDLSKGI